MDTASQVFHFCCWWGEKKEKRKQKPDRTNQDWEQSTLEQTHTSVRVFLCQGSMVPLFSSCVTMKTGGKHAVRREALKKLRIHHKQWIGWAEMRGKGWHLREGRCAVTKSISWPPLLLIQWILHYEGGAGSNSSVLPGHAARHEIKNNPEMLLHTSIHLRNNWRDNYTVCFKFNDSETQRVYAPTKN